MRNIPKPFLSLPLAAAIGLYGQVAWPEVDPEDRQLIKEATCAELREEYPDFVAAEKEIADAIKQHGRTQVAINVLGAATLAGLGFGVFSWDDDTDAQEALAEVREYRIAIEGSARGKGCPLQGNQGNQAKPGKASR